MAEKNGRGPALVVDAVSKSFGAVRAVQEVGFEVERGSLTCLIGPNGAGKSTLLHCVSGFLRQERGRITLEEARKKRVGLRSPRRRRMLRTRTQGRTLGRPGGRRARRVRSTDATAEAAREDASGQPRRLP